VRSLEQIQYIPPYRQFMAVHSVNYMLYCIILYYIILHFIIIYDITLYYIILYYNILYYKYIYIYIEFWMLIAFTSLHRSTVPHESKWLVHVKTRTVCFHNYSDLPTTHILSMTNPLKTIGVSFFWILFQKFPYISLSSWNMCFLKSSYAGIRFYYSEVPSCKLT